MRAVDGRDAYVNLLLPSLLHERGIADRDAAFATELTHGTIRRQGSYDAILDAVTSKGVAAVDPPVRDVLRLGAHQLLSLRTPSHAAVSTSVDLVRAVVGHRPASFVNAVLRKIARHDLDSWLDRVAPSADADPLGSLAVRHSHPRWIVQALRDALGGDLAETAELLAADNSAPEVTLVARPGQSGPDEMAELGAARARFCPYAFHLAGGDPGRLKPVRERRAGVQDEGSQLVALTLARAPLEGSDVRWLDLCAGPGGKAALLAAIAAARGAEVLANELQPHRAELVRHALSRHPNTRVRIGDARAGDWAPGSFDRVLVDAPCTGLGALRRHPEARWRRTEDDVAGLSNLQRQLLNSALDAVRVGGVVAYATCSPHLAETSGVVDVALEHRDDVEVLDAAAVLDLVPGLTGPYVQLWPHRHGTDAMFLALLRRTQWCGG